MKMAKNAAIVLLLLVMFNACTKITGEGPVITQDRASTGFSKLAVSISGEVNYKQDNNYKVEIQAQQNILDILQTNVVNNELVIKFKNDVRVRSNERIIVNVSSPNITGLRISGSGNLHTTGNIQTPEMHLNISGSGNIYVPSLQAENVEAVISGSGDIQVAAGTSNQEELKISGSGNIDLLNVTGKSANTSTSGSGTMKVNVSDVLNASISGSGTVFYRGHPVISANISGSGKVKPI